MHKSELLISGITAKTRDCNSRIHRTGKCSMGRLRKLVLPACFLFTNMFAHATVHGGAIHITVLDSETHSVILDGSGVPKNCDQGRVLLDAAAIKGNKEAADLLRNLQAFGCE